MTDYQKGNHDTGDTGWIKAGEKTTKYQMVNTVQDIRDYLGDAAEIAFDFETAPDDPYREDEKAALDPARGHIVGCSFSAAEGTGIYVRSMQELGRKYPRAGYGGRFYDWIFSEDPQPYNSWGNGAGMRVSPCAWVAGSMEEALELSDIVTATTHNHPEGIKDARAITSCIWLAREGKSQDEIRSHVIENYYEIGFNLDEIRKDYKFDVSCQGSVPQAIEAFLEGTGFEDSIRNAVSIGGDSDTIAAMAGEIGEAYWGVPEEIREKALRFLDKEQIKIVTEFEDRFGRK